MTRQRIKKKKSLQFAAQQSWTTGQANPATLDSGMAPFSFQLTQELAFALNDADCRSTPASLLTFTQGPQHVCWIKMMRGLRRLFGSSACLMMENLCDAGLERSPTHG